MSSFFPPLCAFFPGSWFSYAFFPRFLPSLSVCLSFRCTAICRLLLLRRFLHPRLLFACKAPSGGSFPKCPRAGQEPAKKCFHPVCRFSLFRAFFFLRRCTRRFCVRVLSPLCFPEIRSGACAAFALLPCFGSCRCLCRRIPLKAGRWGPCHLLSSFSSPVVFKLLCFPCFVLCLSDSPSSFQIRRGLLLREFLAELWSFFLSCLSICILSAAFLSLPPLPSQTAFPSWSQGLTPAAPKKDLLSSPEAI